MRFSTFMAAFVVSSASISMFSSHDSSVAATATVPRAQAIEAMTARERMALPDATEVTVHGKSTTLGAIRAAHELRSKQFDRAEQLGRAEAEALRKEEFRVTADGTSLSDASGRIYPLHRVKTKSGVDRLETGVTASASAVAGVASLHIAMPGPSQSGPKIDYRRGSIIAMPNAILRSYADDYQNYCKAADATVCIYLPVVQDWQVVSLSGPDNYHVVATIVDPLITDSKTCRSEGGSMGSAGCEYRYPYTQTIDFQPAAFNPYVLRCPGVFGPNPGSGYEITIDPHGAVAIEVGPGTWDYWYANGKYYFGGVQLTCFIQVYTE
jgi:hypothetical protein